MIRLLIMIIGLVVTWGVTGQEGERTLEDTTVPTVVDGRQLLLRRALST
jgi:hypothetical protein